MEALRAVRHARGLSQRQLAKRAGLSFRGLQLLEAQGHDARLSSLERVADALGLPAGGVQRAVGAFLCEPRDSARSAGQRVVSDGDPSWRTHLFDFVDALRRTPTSELVESPVPSTLSDRLQALFAASVETLARELGIVEPEWVRAALPLPQPWFVAGFESLKASALVESPVAFRSRNVFVLANFLDRA